MSPGSKLGELRLSRDSSWQPVEARRRPDVAAGAVSRGQMTKMARRVCFGFSFQIRSRQKTPEREMSCIDTCTKIIQFKREQPTSIGSFFFFPVCFSSGFLTFVFPTLSRVPK